MTQNDVMQLLIGKDVGAATPTTSTGSAIVEASDTYLVNGEVAVVNAHNIVLDAVYVLTDDLVAQYGIKVIQRSGDKLIESDLIKQNNILAVNGQTDSAYAEQVSYIGYNGSANSLEVNNSTLYVVRLLLKEQSETGQGQEIILNCPYKSDSAATEEEIADGLALSLSNTTRRQAVQPIKAELVNSATVTASNDFDNDATIVKGSTSFTVATNLKYAAAASTLAVDDYVRLGTVGGGTALTSGIYKVTATSGTTVTVDRPIECASGTYAAATSDAEVIPNATAAAADYGVKLTGIAREFDLPKHRYSKVSFDVGLDDGFGDTTVTDDTAMDLGKGWCQQIAELEYDLLGNAGNRYKADFLWEAQKSDAETSGYYDTMSVTYFDDHATEGIGATPRRKKQLVLALKTGFSTTEAPDHVIDVFEAYSTISTGIAV